MTETSGRARSGDVGDGAGTRRDDLPVAGLLGLVARAWSQLPPVVVERVVVSAAEQREIVERRRPTVSPASAADDDKPENQCAATTVGDVCSLSAQAGPVLSTPGRAVAREAQSLGHDALVAPAEYQ